MNASTPSHRILVAAMGALAVVAGMVVGATGCVGALRCPDVDPIEAGRFEIIESPQRPELVGGMVVADVETGLEISYTLDDGTSWVVDYATDVRDPQ